MNKSKKVLFISDTHFPYVNKKAMKKLYKVIQEEQPTHIIQAGDLVDMYSFSRYEKDANHTTPQEELELGLKMASDMWKKIKTICPKAKCIQLIGNHEDRLSKTVAKKAPELAMLCRTIQDLFDFKGVKVLSSSKEWVEIDNVIYCHGWYTKLGDHMKFFNKSVVHGHSHRIGIAYDQRNGSLLFEMDTGFMADKEALPLQYTSSKYTKWSLACGIVTNGKNPRLITLE